MIQSPVLAHDGIAHGFFTRDGGLSSGLYASLNCGLGSGDDKEIVRLNRERVAETLGVSEARLLTVYQVHSPDVVTVTGPWPTPGRPRADALVTATAGVALGVLTADCGPVLFADADAGVIGAAHAGWKGALTGVTGATIAAMERLGARRSCMTAVIGPMIAVAAYEVGPEFPEYFLSADNANERFFAASARAGHSQFDLGAYLAARLAADGVGTVASLGHCTFSDEARFFSYRRATHRGEKHYGRQISAIALR